METTKQQLNSHGDPDGLLTTGTSRGRSIPLAGRVAGPSESRCSLAVWPPRRPCPASGGSVRRRQRGSSASDQSWTSFLLVFPRNRTAPLRASASIRSWRAVAPHNTLVRDADRNPRPLSPRAGLKPAAEEIRRMSSFGSPKRGRVARPNEAKHRRRRVSQVDPPQGGTDARVLRGSVASPAGRVHGRSGITGLHPAVGRAWRGQVNGFPGALTGVLRHPVGGGRSRLSDTSAARLSDAAKAVEPAYPLSYNGAGEGMAPAPPSNPPRVALPWRPRLGAPPPSPRAGAA